MADWIWMPFGMIDQVSPIKEPRIRRGCKSPTDRGSFGGEYEADHCDEWGECGIGNSGGVACSQISF